MAIAHSMWGTMTWVLPTLKTRPPVVITVNNYQTAQTKRGDPKAAPMIVNLHYSLEATQPVGSDLGDLRRLLGQNECLRWAFASEVNGAKVKYALKLNLNRSNNVTKSGSVAKVS